MPYLPQKKAFKKKRKYMFITLNYHISVTFHTISKGNSITPAKTIAPISQTSSECLKLRIQSYQMRNKDLKMKLGQLQEEISKASLPVTSATKLFFVIK